MKLESHKNYVKVKSQNNGKSKSTSLNSSGNIPCRYLEQGITGVLKQDVLHSHKISHHGQQKLIGKVTGICAATVTLNNDTSFNISATNCTWDIVEGDWIICDVGSTSSVQDCEEAEPEGCIQVLACKPLRKKRVRGEVTHCFTTFCVINQEELKSCMIARHLLDFPKHTMSGGENKTINILDNKENIVITQSLRFPSVVLGSQSYIGAFIRNTGTESKTLKRIYFVTPTQECVFSVVFCSAGGLIDGTPVTIDRDMGINIRFECTGKLLGIIKQLCIFDFGTFHIGRYVSAAIEDHNMKCLVPVTPYTPRQNFRNSSQFQSSNREIIKGERPFKTSSFLPVSLPMALVPQQLWQAVTSNADVLDVAPSLSQPLTPDNHKEKLSVLLHLEEIEMTIQIRQFDMARTNFSPHGEYLSLTVPGLAEKRPSLMIGDTVIASSPCDSCDVEYEGYIHEVLHTQVLLKFHPTFHSEYHGEDYSVRFNFNRTPLRRCHLALDFTMKQLGPDILFPSKLKIQLPQVCYIDPEVPTSASSAKKTPHRVAATSYNSNTQVSRSESNETGIGAEVSVKHRSKIGTGTVKTDYHSNEFTTKNKLPCDLLVGSNSVNNTMSDVLEIQKNDASQKLAFDVSEEADRDLIWEKSNNIKKTRFIMKGELRELSQLLNEQQNGVNYYTKKELQKFKNTENCNDRSNFLEHFCKQESSPQSSRIPVVTRLFGVSSSGSSSNSSMCCSDDESRGSVNSSVDNTVASASDNLSASVGLEKDAFHFKKVEKIKLKNNSTSSRNAIDSESKTSLNSEACFISNKPKFCSLPTVTAVETPFSSSKEMMEILKGEQSKLKATPLMEHSHRAESVSPVTIPLHKVNGIPKDASSGKKILFLPRPLELHYHRIARLMKEGGDCKNNQTCRPTVPEEKVVMTDQITKLRKEVKCLTNQTCRPSLTEEKVLRTDHVASLMKEGEDCKKNQTFRPKLPQEKVLTTNRIAALMTGGQICKNRTYRPTLPEELRTDHENPCSANDKQCPRKSDVGRSHVPLSNHLNELKPTVYCEPHHGEQNHESYGSAKEENCYIVPVLPVFTMRNKGVKNLAKLPLLKWFNDSLNVEQKLAVRRVLDGTTRPLPYIIFGPPGTGKTVTLVETALQILTMMQHTRLLIITPSNSASDLVMERLLTYGHLSKMDLVRLNAYQRLEDTIPDTIRPYCCSGDQLSVRVHQRIIVTTATTAGVMYTLGLHNGHFSHVLVDEAGQLTEPECLVALGLVNCSSGQVVLAGDPEQLGPVVQSSLAKRYGLQHSLLQRLCYSVLYQPQEIKSSAWVYQPCLVTQLVKNYRSHPDIFHVPSRLFYHNTLQACADTKMTEQLLKWNKLPSSSCPLLFHGVIGNNLQEGDSPSWFNAAEAFQVVRYTKSLIIFGVKPQDIGIITPYRKQVEKIRKLLTTFGIIENVKVGCVEEFQGQERSVIIISTVRSSTDLIEVDVRHNLGFVKCPKRFNVAVTRAQALLVVVGNPLLLSLDNSWHTLIKFCLEKGAYRGPELDVTEDDNV
nr:RNA helicase Mov10l1-like [Cherax quadricarinatus]